MMAPRIVLCFPVKDHHIDQFQQAAPNAEFVDAGQERIAEELPHADIFIGHAKVPVPWDAVVEQGRLQWIQSSAAGMDHCLVPSVIGAEIPVTSVSGLFANQVAEQTMALLMGLIRSLPTFFRAQQVKEFIRRPTHDLHGKTIGIVGCGGNGRRIAEVLRPWQVEVIGTDLYPSEDWISPADQLPSLLKRSDIVILALPLNEQTRGYIGRAELEMMKTGAMLINVARGPVVVEADLVQALEAGHLLAAGLDVTEVEPLPQDSPLWQMDQVIITPHVGAQSARRVDDTVVFACDNLKRFLSGRPLRNVVDKRLGFPTPESRGDEASSS